MEIKRSVWWKVYFFFIVGITALGSIAMLSDEAAGIAEAIYIPMSLVGSIGLFGFVFSKKIFRQTFWLYFVAIYVAMSIAYFFITNTDTSAGLTQEGYLYVTIFSWIISMPGYTGLLLYGLPSNKLWQQNA